MTDADTMLETLKTEHLGMKYQVEITKELRAGAGEGVIVTETMPFVDWYEAVNWAERVNHNRRAPFRVLAMRGNANQDWSVK